MGAVYLVTVCKYNTAQSSIISWDALMEIKDKLSGIKQIEKMEEEIKEWFYYLDSFVGVLSFTLAVTCFSTSGLIDGVITACASWFFILLIGAVAQKQANVMPTVMEVRRLRDKYKNNKDDPLYKKYEHLCSFVNNQFMRVIKAPIFLAGYSALSACVVWNLTLLVIHI